MTFWVWVRYVILGVPSQKWILDRGFYTAESAQEYLTFRNKQEAAKRDARTAHCEYELR